MALQQFFPFSPDYMTWDEWNGNMVLFYSEEPIPYNQEDEWQETAKNIAQLPTFLNYPVPDPTLFENWQDWAKQFTLIINGPTQ